MTRSIPNELLTDANRPVLAHVKEMSAHSDIADALAVAVKSLGDIQLFCPDREHCRYVLVSTKGVIFGFAIGAHTIAFRLDDRLKSRALATGAEPYPACGPDWVSFIPFRDDWPRVDLAFWALKAYVYARETS